MNDLFENHIDEDIKLLLMKEINLFLMNFFLILERHSDIEIER